MSIEPDENEVMHPKIKYTVCRNGEGEEDEKDEEKGNFKINYFDSSYIICHWIRQHFL